MDKNYFLLRVFPVSFGILTYREGVPVLWFVVNGTPDITRHWDQIILVSVKLPARIPRQSPDGATAYH